MDPLIGMIFLFAGNFAPVGYALCNGQLLPISTYAALFSILGTTYGGNGTSNFALPDLRGRVPLGSGQGTGLSFYNLGQMVGAESTSLTVSNLPAHNHYINVDGTDLGAKLYPGPNHFLAGSTAAPYTSNVPNATLPAQTISATGSNLPFNNMQPSAVLNYIIAVQGIFPSRN